MPDPQTIEFTEDDFCTLMQELTAKAWQSTRRGNRHQDHVCGKAVRALRQLMLENDKLKRKLNVSA
jgi:hypothetical protein